jgi:hypothetical protein
MTDPAETPDFQPTQEADEKDPGWPLSFILLVVAGGLYLVLRFFQMARDLLA